MGRAKEWTVEEYEDWLASSAKYEAVAEAADETGGPRLSLVPVPPAGENGVWPTDLLPPADPPLASEGTETRSLSGGQASIAGTAESGGGDSPCAEPQAAMPFDGVALEDSRKRLAGWSAERQRLFLEDLAETGSVHLAAAGARLSARSAYRLRARSPAFATAWNAAQQIAVGRLSALAFDRAIHGRVEQVFRDGELVAERRLPSDRLLTWLLARLDPRRFALPWEQRGNADPQAEAVATFPDLLDAITDTPS